VDSKTSSIIEETKKIQIRRKPTGSSSYVPNSVADTFGPPNDSFNQAESAARETQLKSSRDVRCHMLIYLVGKYVVLSS